MLVKESDNRLERLRRVAGAMMTAARTAPKGCGIDELEIAMIEGETKERVIAQMREIGTRPKHAFFLRDANNVEGSDVVVLIGTRNGVRALNCGLCGYPACAEKIQKAPLTPCVFNVTDLGIATGSAAAIAIDNRVDNRIMYSAGLAARELGLMPKCIIIYAIPLSSSGKSIYFDRKSAAKPETISTADGPACAR